MRGLAYLDLLFWSPVGCVYYLCSALFSQDVPPLRLTPDMASLPGRSLIRLRLARQILCALCSRFRYIRDQVHSLWVCHQRIPVVSNSSHQISCTGKMDCHSRRHECHTDLVLLYTADCDSLWSVCGERGSFCTCRLLHWTFCRILLYQVRTQQG